jgi:hypothetical protein
MDFNDKISRASLHIEVADRVREMIFDRSLPPGYRIDELDLSAKLGTSRTPLREALKVLAAAPSSRNSRRRKWNRCSRCWQCWKAAAPPKRSGDRRPRICAS